MHHRVSHRRLIIILGLYILTSLFFTAGSNPVQPARPAPEFTHDDPRDWINSEPLQLSDLRGRVLLIDIWTFGCWNCYRSFPWLKTLEAQFSDESFQVIGVHSPEFEHEKVRANIETKVDEFGLEHPIMIDNDFSYWKALDNRYWPAFYLIDKRGNLRAVFVDETHAGDVQARRIEQMISTLLAETIE